MKKVAWATFRRYSKAALTLGKLILAKVLAETALEGLRKKDIWIIKEKETEARDNGYHLFKYIRQTHPEQSAYFAITRDSADFERVRALGNDLADGSFRHCVYHFACSRSIGSQPNGAYPGDWRLNEITKKYLKIRGRIVNIKHGIVKDELHHGLDFARTNEALVSASSERERSFVIETFKYPPENVRLLGLCRYDNLDVAHEKARPVILIMPTFRIWLKAEDETRDATRSEREAFERSEFFRTYAGLLNDARLRALLKARGYSLVFYPHYSVQSYLECFRSGVTPDENIVVAGRKAYDVQELLNTGSLLITDYSSVFFDFAYMNKPVIYFQFDEEEYRANHYKAGYFSYRDDGFGPVVGRAAELLDALEEALGGGCALPAAYRKRADGFFAYRDQKNCERTYEAIKALKD